MECCCFRSFFTRNSPNCPQICTSSFDEACTFNLETSGSKSYFLPFDLLFLCLYLCLSGGLHFLEKLQLLLNWSALCMHILSMRMRKKTMTTVTTHCLLSDIAALSWIVFYDSSIRFPFQRDEQKRKKRQGCIPYKTCRAWFTLLYEWFSFLILFMFPN